MHFRALIASPGRSLAGLAAFAVLAGAAFDAIAYARALAGKWGAPRLAAREVTAGGARGFVLEAGQGEVVVVLASQLVRARTYLPLVRRLARSRRVLVVEMPGSGRAERLDGSWPVPRYAAWVSALFDALAPRERIEGVTLVGHSNSGPVALAVAERDARVARLVLVGTVGARARRGLARVVAARVVDGLEEACLSLRAAWHFAWNIAAHTRSLLAQIRFSGAADLLSAPRPLRVPTLLVWGARDRTMPPASAERLLRALPGARIALGPGSHDWLVTHPAAFARVVFGDGFGDGSERRSGGSPRAA